jgi:hypothetical protein
MFTAHVVSYQTFLNQLKNINIHDDSSKIRVKRLNPKDKEDDNFLMGFFPPNNSCYTDLQNERFKSFLMSYGTTKEGQKMIAEYYKVRDLWKDIAKPDCDFERYLNLLLLVKTKSQVDNLWVSFVELTLACCNVYISSLHKI